MLQAPRADPSRADPDYGLTAGFAIPQRSPQPSDNRGAPLVSKGLRDRLEVHSGKTTQTCRCTTR